jgi:hypothetical protein
VYDRIKLSKREGGEANLQEDYETIIGQNVWRRRTNQKPGIYIQLLIW